MNAARLSLLLAACVIATGWSGAAESARRKPEPTLGALAGRSAPIDRSQAVQAAPDAAAAEPPTEETPPVAEGPEEKSA